MHERTVLPKSSANLQPRLYASAGGRSTMELVAHQSFERAG